VHQRRVEKHGIPFFQRQLHVMRIEVSLELGMAGHQIAGPVFLRMRQVQRGATFGWHVHVGQWVRAERERVMPPLQPAIFCARCHWGEDLPVVPLVTMREKIAKQGCHGVLLKAPDRPTVVRAMAPLQHKGIPVVTLVTDLPASARRAYVGKLLNSGGYFHQNSHSECYC
jgi:hypothetical protein